MHADVELRLSCGSCNWQTNDLERVRCPDCDGQLAPEYNGSAIEASDVLQDDDRNWIGDLLTAADERSVALGEGGTPLVDCPALAAELEIDALAVKDEGHNPTGTLADRAIAVAITAASEAGATDVALPTTGADGVAAAAYAARADLDAHVFVPTRSTHTTKAMINVHGGDMNVVEGRLPDAVNAFRSALEEDEGWRSLRPADAPLRPAGIATAYPELVASLDGAAPDAVVVPTAHGEAIVGLHAAATLLADLGIVDRVPAFHAVQPEGCAPIVRAVDDGDDEATVWDGPDTISGALEIADPSFDRRAIAAVRDSGGTGIAVDDEAILASACRIAAAEGLQASVAGGAAAAGAWELSQTGQLDPDETVVLLNTGAGSLDSDVLRSHLMRAG